jgi:hypothetical protein
MNDVTVHHEVRNGSEGAWQLCFQWVTYTYDTGTPSERGYRFIWRRPDGSLQPARGQTRIPSAADLFELLQLATRDGWFIAAESLQPFQAQLPLA